MRIVTIIMLYQVFYTKDGYVQIINQAQRASQRPNALLLRPLNPPRIAHDLGHAPGLAGFSQRGSSAPLNFEASDHEAGIDDGARVVQRRLSPVNGNPGHENRHNDAATGTAVVRAPLLRQSAEEDEISLPSQLPEVPILPAAGAGMPGLPSGAPFPTAVASPRGGDGGNGGDDNSSLVDEGGTPISLIPNSTVSNKVFDNPDRAELGACAPRPQGGTEAAAVALAGSTDEAPDAEGYSCLLYTSPSPRDKRQSRMPSSA